MAGVVDGGQLRMWHMLQHEAVEGAEFLIECTADEQRRRVNFV